MRVGDTMEWKPLHAPGTMRGVISRIHNGRVYLTTKRTFKHRGRETERDDVVWFEPDEIHRLKLVTP